jgi:MFS family permease
LIVTANFRMRLKLTGLWHHADFLRLWSGQTLSVFGSMIGGTAMTFTATLFLRATPFQMGVLNAMQVAPAFLGGLFAGAWVDRMRRRPLLIGTDLGRALVLSCIPLAAFAGRLRIELLYLVAVVVSMLTVIFDVAYHSYLPGLIGKSDLVEGNSKLSASAAAAEFGGFSIAGWLVQTLTAPFAILIDAGSFVVSAITVGLIRAREQSIIPQAHADMRQEIAQGLQFVWRMPLLRATALATLILGLSRGICGALVVFYMNRDLGFTPGILGLIWAVGAVSSSIGAAFTPLLTRRLGAGPAMILGLTAFGVSLFFIPMARGATLLSATLLVAQQLGDGFYVVYDVTQVSIRQKITSEHLLGRVNATFQFLSLGTSLLGSLLGGLLSEVLGVRSVLVLGGCVTLLAALMLAAPPVRRFGGTAVADDD